MKTMPSAPWLTFIALLLVVACGSDGPEASAATDRAPQEAREATAPGPSRPVAGRAWVIFGADTVVVEVARTADERAQGLKFRDELPAGTGMLFVFPDLATRSFWMQDTYIALDIAYLGASFEIVDIQQMEPLTTQTYPSAAPAMYALEVPLGWFTEHGIEVGDVPEVIFGG
jgi:uncharacterized protein